MQLQLDVDESELEELGLDPELAMRTFKTLTLTALRLTARDACLRVQVRATEDGQVVELESVCSGECADRPRLHRLAGRMPTETEFAVRAARTLVCPTGGRVDASYMESFGIHITLHIPRTSLRSRAS